jgi:prepilin-type processing-associated H-X9-DG protein
MPDGMNIPANEPWPLGPNGAVSATHAGLSNFLMCDGHVKAMLPTDTDPDIQNRPNSDMWDARRTADSP